MFIQDMGIGKLLVTVFAAALLMLLEMFLCLCCIPITLKKIPVSKLYSFAKLPLKL